MSILENKSVRKTLFALCFLVLPLIALFVGIVAPVYNAWYFVLAISWFGLGLIFFVSVED